MTTDYTAKARELVCAAYADFGVGLPDLEPMTAIFAAALREAVEAEREELLNAIDKEIDESELGLVRAQTFKNLIDNACDAVDSARGEVAK